MASMMATAASAAVPGEGGVSSSKQRLMVVGGGPIGLEMAVAAVRSGKWDVTVVEQGGEICENVRSWSHVKVGYRVVGGGVVE